MGIININKFINMKGAPFVICALLGATQAANEPNYDDTTQY